MLSEDGSCSIWKGANKVREAKKIHTCAICIILVRRAARLLTVTSMMIQEEIQLETWLNSEIMWIISAIVSVKNYQSSAVNNKWIERKWLRSFSFNSFIIHCRIFTSNLGILGDMYCVLGLLHAWWKNSLVYTTSTKISDLPSVLCTSRMLFSSTAERFHSCSLPRTSIDWLPKVHHPELVTSRDAAPSW